MFRWIFHSGTHGGHLRETPDFHSRPELITFCSPCILILQMDRACLRPTLYRWRWRSRPLLCGIRLQRRDDAYAPLKQHWTLHFPSLRLSDLEHFSLVLDPD